MRFHVLGLGPIGSLIAHNLRLSLGPNHEIVLVHKSDAHMRKALRMGNVITVERNGVRQTSSGFLSEVFREPIPIPKPPAGRRKRLIMLRKEKKRLEQQDDSADDSEIESLIITTKAHSVLPAVKALVPRLTTSSTIVLLHNGMGVYELLAKEIFRNPLQRPHIIVGSNTHGAYSTAPSHVIHAGMGALEFGIVTDPNGRDFEAALAEENASSSDKKLALDSIASAEEADTSTYLSLRNTVAALANLQGLHSSWQPISDILVAMKRKLVVNAVINPLTALLNCRNGDLRDNVASSYILKRVCAEAAMAFALQSQAEEDDHDGVSRKEAKARLLAVRSSPAFRPYHPGLTPESLEAECLRVAKITGGNISSMLADVRKNSKTEVSFINGHLAYLGRKYGYSMPTNSVLLDLMRMRESIPFDLVEDNPNAPLRLWGPPRPSKPPIVEKKTRKKKSDLGLATDGASSNESTSDDAKHLSDDSKQADHVEQDRT